MNASGYVVAQRRAAVASKGAGRLVELRVKEGDRVRKGEIVACLESADVAAALSRANANMNVAHSAYDQAKAELNEAALSYERKKSLLESGLVSKADFDSTEARYRRAEAGEVVTPFGSSTLAKAAVVTIADMNSLQVEADVSESNIEKAHISQPGSLLEIKSGLQPGDQVVMNPPEKLASGDRRRGPVLNRRSGSTPSS